MRKEESEKGQPRHLPLKFFTSASDRKGLDSGCVVIYSLAASSSTPLFGSRWSTTCDKPELSGHVWLSIGTESES